MPGQIQVRARNKQHLKNLIQHISLLKDKSVSDTPIADYGWRLVLSPEEWAAVSGVLASDAGDYSNFKGQCSEQAQQKKLDWSYINLLHDIWHLCFRYQSRFKPKPLFDHSREVLPLPKEPPPVPWEQELLDPYDVQELQQGRLLTDPNDDEKPRRRKLKKLLPMWIRRQ